MTDYDTPNALIRNDLALKPNQRLVLVHPENGYLPLTVVARVPFKMIFNRILTDASVTTLASLSTIDGIQLFDSTNRDQIEVRTDQYLYHLFIGLSPPSLRCYFEFPKGTIQRIPDNQNFAPTALYGYIDGHMSPFGDPSPDFEVFLPPGRNMTNFRFYNPTTLAMVNPLLNMIGYTYRMKVIRNADLVQAVLDERPGFAARKEIVGGLQGYPYDARLVYDADWIPFGAQRRDIEKAISRVQKGGE